jgi:hypothetical protein
MFITVTTEQHQYHRHSKHGVSHAYTRKKTVAVLRCDACDTLFRRDLKHMSRQRLNNNFFHCCSNCDSKRFAQRKGVEQKQIWNMPASVELPVAKF